MKTIKNRLFLATAILALVSCADNTYLGDQEGNTQGGGAISFNMNTPAMTRATQEDATAAATLGNRFIVWGEKNESGTTAATDANTVFKNYTVVYGASTAHTTASNTDDWEYVGQTSYTTKLTPNAPASQTIKYWDNDASSYTFTAVSALDADITGDKVVITKNTSGTSDVYDKGYTIVVKSGASAGNIFFADRIHDTPANLGNNAVKFTFRNLQAKIRFGIFEKIPGYTVSIDKVYYNNTNSSANFGVDGKFIKPDDNTSFTVTYGNGTTGPQDKALIAVSANTYDNSLASTSTTIMSATEIGTSSSEATMDGYVSILPYTSNTTDLSFTIDYTLKSQDTGETIAKKGKVVKVPAAYCKWQSNYAYTYLFKITDSDLTPITFDACYVEDEVGNQETITTVETPSITTYAKGQNPTQAAKAEYPTGSNIYVMVDNNGNVETLSTSNAKLYFVTNSGTGTEQLITEASVANALATTGTDTNADSQVDTWTVTGVGMKSLIVTTINVPILSFVSTISAVDSPTGVAINIDGTNNQGAKFTPVQTYTAVTPVGSENPSESSWYEKSSETYTVSSDTTVDGTKTYYTKDSSSYYVFEYTYTVSNETKKAYKVIKVVAAP